MAGVQWSLENGLDIIVAPNSPKLFGLRMKAVARVFVDCILFIITNDVHDYPVCVILT